MDPEYQLDADMAAVVVNLTAVPSATPMEGLASMVSVISPPASVESLHTVSTWPSANSTMWPSTSAASWSTPIPVSTTSTTLPTTPGTPSVQLVDSRGDLGRRLEESLHQLQEGLRHLNQPPTVVVVNQPVPVPPRSWYQEVDGAAAGSVAAVVIFILVVVGCFLIRRYRPQAWKRVKETALHVLQWAALPASWAFSKASDALRRFHHATPETDQQAAASQV